MSEDESMGDSENLMEEDEDDEDSSSESVDEEIKLTKNFVDALARIELNKNNYDDYVLLVSSGVHCHRFLFLHFLFVDTFRSTSLTT